MNGIRIQSNYFPYNLRKAVAPVASIEEASREPLDLVEFSSESLRELQGSANSDQNPWQEEELLLLSDEAGDEDEVAFEVEELDFQQLAQNFSSFSLVA